MAHDVRSAVKDRPANIVSQPLVVKHESANGFRKLVTLPLALTPSCVVGPGIGSRSPYGFDGIGGSTQFVCSDVRDGPGLARRVRSIPGRPPQVPGRAHRMSTRRASLHHLDLTTCPSPGMLDRLAGPGVLRVGHLKQVENVLCARCRPQRQKVVVRIGQAATAPDRHKAGVPDLRQNHVDILLTGPRAAVRQTSSDYSMPLTSPKRQSSTGIKRPNRAVGAVAERAWLLNRQPGPVRQSRIRFCRHH